MGKRYELYSCDLLYYERKVNCEINFKKVLFYKLVHGKTVIPPKEPPLPSFRVNYSKQSELIMPDQYFLNLQ